MIRHDMGNRLCPYCGGSVASASPLSDDLPMRPVPGDYSLCASCRYLSRYDENIKARRLTSEELDEVRESELWPMVQKARQMLADAEHQSWKMRDLPGETP